MRKELSEALEVILKMQPQAYAFVYGSDAYREINGLIYLYPLWDGTLVVVDVSGLPQEEGTCVGMFMGFHIHEGDKCSGTAADPFADVLMHFNPEACEHPKHAGDMPPIFNNNGYALNMFYTNRFVPEEIIGRTVVIHDKPDDFKTQPSGNSGTKIACGVICGNEIIDM